MNSSYISPFAKPVYIMLKPVGSVCNLACEYCYYLEKSKFYPDVKNHIMTDQILEKFIKEYMECQTMQEVLFTWHGGETLMRPISFYKKALELQRKYAGGRQIDNCIQTNGTLLNDEWCQFFKENNFLVGVSIDGPQEFHDEYRKNKLDKLSFAIQFFLSWNVLPLIRTDATSPHWQTKRNLRNWQTSPSVRNNGETSSAPCSTNG